MLKRLRFLPVAVLAATLSAPLAAQDAADPSTVVASVNGVEITLGHMIIAHATLPQEYQQYPADVLFTGILDQLIEQTALVGAHDGQVSDTIRLSLENEERSLLAADVVEALLAEPLDAEAVRSAYDTAYPSGSGGEEYNASHILVGSEEEANDIKAELDAGADFATVAKEKSTGPSGPGGGSLGWFGAGQMVPDFEKAVIALGAGEVSVPVQTQFGWHVIILNEKRAKSAPPFETVRPQIEQQVRRDMIQAHIAGLVEKAKVTRADTSGIDAAVLRNLDLLGK